MPGSWMLTPSSSPSPSPHVSDSTSCDYKGSGTWGGRQERVLLGEINGWQQEEGLADRWQVCMVGGRE